MNAKSPDAQVEFCFQREDWQGTRARADKLRSKRRSEIAPKVAAARRVKAKTD